MEWKVPYIDLPLQYRNLKSELNSEFERVMNEGSFILRDDVKKFEENMASFLGVKQVVGVNSGTDALYLSAKAVGLKKGDEVITVALLPYAIFAIINAGATPCLIDIAEDFNMDMDKIEKAITPRTKAILPVHLNGRACQMDKLGDIAKKHNLIIIEDAAPSIGAKFKGRCVGSFGTTGCFSTHPMKNLSSAGDGGFISTNNEELAAKFRLLRNLGKTTKPEFSCLGYSSRLDNLQAAILNVKFKYLNEWANRRREIASIYNEKLANLPLILLPEPSQGDFFDIYNSYIIRYSRQQELCSYLRERGIEAFIHFPKPVCERKELNIPYYSLPVTEKICKEAVSLPIYPEMNDKQIDYVIKNLKEFFKNG